MSDSAMTLGELKEKVAAFRDDRDWAHFHNPMDHLAVSLSIEASELLELFQWKTSAEVTEMAGDGPGRQRIAEQLAGVTIYCLNNSLESDSGEPLAPEAQLSRPRS